MLKKYFIFFVLIIFTSCISISPKYTVSYELKVDFSKYERRMNKVFNDELKEKIVKDTITILKNRYDKMEASDINIINKGNDIITIQARVSHNPEEIKKYILISSFVEFKHVDDKYSAIVKDYFEKNIHDQKKLLDDNYQREVLDIMSQSVKVPDTMETLFYYDLDNKNSALIPKYPVVLHKESTMNGMDIVKVWESNNEYGMSCIYFTTTDQGRVKLADATSSKNRFKRLAIVVDEKVRSMPTIADQITTGKGMISGNFTKKEIEMIILFLRIGTIPVDLKIVSEKHNRI